VFAGDSAAEVTIAETFRRRIGGTGDRQVINDELT
jgi:hypothetical protein